MEPFDSLGGRYGLQTTSEVISDLRFEISDLDYLHIHVHIAYMVWILLTASVATTASKQPRGSDLTSDLKSVTSITYISLCISQISQQTAEEKHLLHSSGAPWGQIWAPPGGKVAMTYLDHALKYQPNWPTNN